MNGKPKTLKILTWGDVREKVIGLNPFIGNEIDAIPNAQQFKVLSVRYPFGAKIIDKGSFYLCIDGESVPFNSDLVPQQVRNILNYKWEGMPFGIVVKNSTESFIDHSRHVVPFYIKLPGKTFALLSIFNNPHFIASLRSEVAGCRSLLMLPKITDSEGLRRLKNRYRIQFDEPNDLSDHWGLFKKLMDSPAMESTWYAELLYFSYEFIEGLSATLAFREKLLTNVWEVSSFTLNLKTYDFIWSVVINKIIQEDRLPKAVLQDPFIIQTAKHLLKIACREVPGFIPATTDLAGPVKTLTEVFLNDYKLRGKLPTFMQLGIYNGIEPVYYTLSRHTFAHDVPTLSYKRQTVMDLKHIQQIIAYFRDFVLRDEGEHPLQNTALYRILLETEFSFFHPKADMSGLESDINLLRLDDRRFNYQPFVMKNDCEFAAASIFFHGCIRIRPKSRNFI
jgi:hypothetical protein